ncbi:hypothetical protein ACOME3_000429 [Neoechinorhynchus agilis]
MSCEINDYLRKFARIESEMKYLREENSVTVNLLKLQLMTNKLTYEAIKTKYHQDLTHSLASTQQYFESQKQDEQYVDKANAALRKQIHKLGNTINRRQAEIKKVNNAIQDLENDRTFLENTLKELTVDQKDSKMRLFKLNLEIYRLESELAEIDYTANENKQLKEKEEKKIAKRQTDCEAMIMTNKTKICMLEHQIGESAQRKRELLAKVKAIKTKYDNVSRFLFDYEKINAETSEEMSLELLMELDDAAKNVEAEIEDLMDMNCKLRFKLSEERSALEYIIQSSYNRDEDFEIFATVTKCQSYRCKRRLEKSIENMQKKQAILKEVLDHFQSGYMKMREYWKSLEVQMNNIKKEEHAIIHKKIPEVKRKIAGKKAEIIKNAKKIERPQNFFLYNDLKLLKDYLQDFVGAMCETSDFPVENGCDNVQERLSTFQLDDEKFRETDQSVSYRYSEVPELDNFADLAAKARLFIKKHNIMKQDLWYGDDFESNDELQQNELNEVNWTDFARGSTSL